VSLAQTPGNTSPVNLLALNKSSLTFRGVETSTKGQLRMVFDGEKATVVDALNQTANGTVRFASNRVTITLDDRVYEGVLRGNVLAGSGRVTAGRDWGQMWTFTVTAR